MNALTSSADLKRAVERFVEFLETGIDPPALFTEDVFCDFTMPTWRLQAQGRSELTALRRRGHPAPGRVVRHSALPTADGFVLEVEECWTDDRDDWYCRECFRARLAGPSIAELSVYCTGDWSSRRQQQHADAVTLLRP